VGDVVHAILLAINCESKFSIMNLGSGESHSVEEIIRIIQNLKNTNIPIFSIGDRRKDEVMNTIADITEAKRRLGWTPSWNLKLGLESTLGWYGGT
jgi:nucleoside-diphosphate-sugar epimerase